MKQNLKGKQIIKRENRRLQESREEEDLLAVSSAPSSSNEHSPGAGGRASRVQSRYRNRFQSLLL